MGEPDLKAEILLLKEEWQRNIDKIKEIEELTKVARTLLLKDEIQIKYKDLFNENLVLNQLIKDYELALNEIMNKFRTQSLVLVQTHSDHQNELLAERKRNEDRVNELEIENLKYKQILDEMCSMLRANLQEEPIENEILVHRLITENETFKSILGLE